jgi:hypothetical protein
MTGNGLEPAKQFTVGDKVHIVDHDHDWLTESPRQSNQPQRKGRERLIFQ